MAWHGNAGGSSGSQVSSRARCQSLRPPITMPSGTPDALRHVGLCTQGQHAACVRAVHSRAAPFAHGAPDCASSRDYYQLLPLCRALMAPSWPLDYRTAWGDRRRHERGRRLRRLSSTVPIAAPCRLARSTRCWVGAIAVVSPADPAAGTDRDPITDRSKISAVGRGALARGGAAFRRTRCARGVQRGVLRERRWLDACRLFVSLALQLTSMSGPRTALGLALGGVMSLLVLPLWTRQPS